jgi:hypothetical protein
MKTLLLRASLALGIALLAFSSSTLAWNKGCSNSTLEGDYAFTVSGTIFMPNNVTVTREGIALTHFDGKGNLEQVDYVLSNGVCLQDLSIAKMGFTPTRPGPTQ